MENDKNIETVDKSNLAHSPLGKTSFMLMILSIITNIAARSFASEQSGNIGIILSLFMAFTSLIIAIIDIRKKNRRKTLSIISLVISGTYLGIFIFIVGFLLMFNHA